MTPEAQRIAIHEAVSDWRLDFEKQKWQTEDVKFLLSMGCVPNYPWDLNAIHEAVMSQSQEVRMAINSTLMEMMRPHEAFVLDRTINATPAQRAEAFLRACNLWRDS